jgi:acyl phosphate:glycerol-3-phosphate acyltransferase
MEYLVIFLAAFLLGSIPFGILMAHAFTDVKDLQARGSGNIGATNVSRVAGFWPAGFLTFLFDFLKGVLPVFVVSLAAFQTWYLGLFQTSGEISLSVIWLAGFCTVLGHCFSPWVKFKGGKGVATGLGVLAVLAPIAAAVGVVSFVFCFLKTKTGSLSSIVGLMMAAATDLVIKAPGTYGAHLWIGAALIFLILFRHESNMDSLLEGKERKF